MRFLTKLIVATIWLILTSPMFVLICIFRPHLISVTLKLWFGSLLCRECGPISSCGPHADDTADLKSRIQSGK